MADARLFYENYKDDKIILLQDIADNIHKIEITTDDVMKKLSSLSTDLSEAIPQLNYVGFSAYSILIPELLAAIKSALTLPQPQAIGIAWNMIDAILQIVGGSLQIHSAVTGDTHKPISTGIEGGINISSGVQLIALTALSVSLGAIGFAVALGVASAFAVKNTIESARKCVDNDYWIKDSLEILALSKIRYAADLRERHQQIDRIHKEVDDKKAQAKKVIEDQQIAAEIEDQQLAAKIKEFNDEALPAERLHPETLNVVTDMMIRFIKNRLEESDQGINKLQTDIFARLVTDYVEKGNKSYLMSKNVDFDQFTSSQKECLLNIKLNPPIRMSTKLQNNKDHNTGFNQREKLVNSILKNKNETLPLPKDLISYDGYNRVVTLSAKSILPPRPENNVLYLKKVGKNAINAYSLENGTKKLTTDEVQAFKNMKGLSFPKDGEQVVEISRNRNQALVEKIISACGYTPYEDCKSITKQSKEECRKETCLKAIDALYITLAFAGMVCLCIPSAQLFAPFFIAPAAAYFTAKYSVQIGVAVKSIHAFFSKKENHKSTEEKYPLDLKSSNNFRKKGN